ncbi:hypothetical protein AMJ80_09175 [bacterium SM23_31]|nr:MAG: hypothetical protein AMJ80_09175 [bacterium SM23_31]
MRVIIKKSCYVLTASTLFIIFANYSAFGQILAIPPELYTRAERTNYEETSLHKDVMNFVYALQKHSDIAHLEIIGASKKGRDIPLVVMADPPVKTPEEAVKSDKPVIYIQGNIHAGEVEGKEASMELMREIAFGPKRRLLSDQIILFCPIYNADGNDSLSATSRRSQEGSPQLTGTRSSGEGYDLNRDGLRIEALETIALIENVILKWNPALFMDLHTTNGSWHGYSLTYAPGNHTAGHPGTTDYLMNVLFPAVQKKVKERSGLDIYLYGNFGGMPPESFTATPHMPRFLTNSMALKNKLAILVETFAHDRFEKRILSNTVFITSVLEFTNEHGGEILKVIKKAEEETVQQVLENTGNFQKGVQFRVAQLGEPSDLLVYETEEYVDESGRPIQRRTGKLVWMPNVRMMQRYEPVKMSTVPRGYVFPAELKNVADKLKQHGVDVKVLEKSTSFEGEEFLVTGFSQAERPYQNHNLVTIEGEFKKAVKEFPAGFFHVDLAQPFAYLVFYMLEPEADDGLAVWNYFDKYLKAQGVENKSVPYPVFKYITIKK